MPLRALVVLALASVAAATDAEKKYCYLKGGDVAKKPFPSLTQCYKQNQVACCVSAHDSSIADSYSGILSGTCIREYEDLEQYYCLGCSPDSDTYITWYNATGIGKKDAAGKFPSPVKGKYREYTAATKHGAKRTVVDELNMVTNELTVVSGKFGEIRVCESFAKKLMYHKENKEMKGVVDAYDHCGLTVSGEGDLGRMLFALTDEEQGMKVGALAAKGAATPAFMDDMAAGFSDGVGVGDGYGNMGKKNVGASTYEEFASAMGKGKRSWLDGYVASTKVPISPEWKFFQMMRPPYYTADKFEVSWYHKSSADNPCFGAAASVQVGFMAAAVVAFAAQLLA